MKRSILILGIIVQLISLSALNVYIWKNENPTAQIVNAETGYPSSAGNAIGHILDDLGIANVVTPDLNTSLSDYDLVIVSLGTFCES